MIIVPKFQNGSAMLPFTYYEALPSGGRKTATSETKETDNNEEFKLIADLLKGLDGLPSDVNKITEELLNSMRLDNPFDTSDIATKYIQALNLIKSSKFEKEQYDSIYKSLQGSGAMDELAITDRGQLIVMNEDGKIKKMSVSEYKKDPEKYQPLTNSNLLYLRAYDHPFDSTITQELQNPVSMQTIYAKLKENLPKLDTNEENVGRYSRHSTGDIRAGLNIITQNADKFLQGNTEAGLYEEQIITKDQLKQVQAAKE